MVTNEEYCKRRQALAEMLPKGTIAIIPAAKEYYRNGDNHYRYRQDSDFLYMSGFDEPEAVLIILKHDSVQSILFNRPRNPDEEQWTGPRLGQHGAIEYLGMDNAFDIKELDTMLPELMSDCQHVFLAFNSHPEWHQLCQQSIQVLESRIRRGISAPEQIHNLKPYIANMRLIKSHAELELMRKAANISANAHILAMQKAPSASYEYELDAILRYEFKRHGCNDVAYEPIVGAGNNGCVLHYKDNNAPINHKDLILIDSGGEYQHYAADITRTFPASGRFSPEQRAIYDLVLEAQKAGIACIKPGTPWNMIQETMVKILSEGMLSLGLLKGSLDEIIDKQLYRKFYMHNSGHWLGLDVHDTGHYKINGSWRPLEPNMVLTVEPGIYIGRHLTDVDERFLGIGVRIEDDIAVTEHGHENLSQAVPVMPDEIEAIMRE